MSYQTIDDLDFVTSYRVRQPYQQLVLKFPDLASVLEFQVDETRATTILRAIDEAHSQDPGTAARLIDDLFRCASYAISDVYNSSASVKGAIHEDLFNRLHSFIRTELKFEPIPNPSRQNQTSETSTRKSAKIRDCNLAFDIWSGAQCTLTGLPNAEMAHILPYKVAGAVHGYQWFWIWAAICLPSPIYQATWDLCGGPRQHRLANVIIMCQPLHRYFDQLLICFKPKVLDDVAFELELEVAREVRPSVTFPKLRRKVDDAPLTVGMRFRWEPQIPTERNDAPSPLLFSLHRWITHHRHLFFEGWSNGIICVPPRSPFPYHGRFSNDSLRWNLVQGKERTSSRASTASPRSSPRSSHNSPISPIAQIMNMDGSADQDVPAFNLDSSDEFMDA